MVANNPFGEGLGHLPHSDDPAAGKLALYLSASLGRMDLLRMSGAALLGQWQDNPMREALTADAIVAHVGSPRVHASVDGELLRLDQPLRFRTCPGALRVIVPKAATQEAAPDRTDGCPIIGQPDGRAGSEHVASV